MFSKDVLVNTAKELLAPGKGILAMDESSSTCNKRFEKLGIAQTEEMRRKYRELIVTTPELNEYISGAILYDETVGQKASDGVLFVQKLIDLGIVPGVKVDMKTQAMPFFPGESLTQGLDGLRERLVEYAKKGARFAKWRAVIKIGDEMPTDACMQANAHALALYAAFCQEASIVPIVEPEVLMEGDHTIQQCYDVTQKMLHYVFDQLYRHRVLLEGIILKPNMILAGSGCSTQPTVDEVAEATVSCLRSSVPATVAGIAFLSGGQDATLASLRLNTMNHSFKAELPWRVTFSFSRAIQQPALDAWKGEEQNVKTAQSILYNRAMCNAKASIGVYSPDMD